MMQSQYTQDVEFNSGFGALQTPVHLYTAAAICGMQAPPVNRPFRYLDIACGNGLTLALLADAYPAGEFVGIDINPEHVEKGQHCAANAGLTNIRFQTGDVIDQAAGDLGEFDYCAMSGAYAWLDDARRAATRALLSSVVKAGGIAYVDYSSQPGIAQVGPLYHVLRELGNTVDGSSADKLSAAAKLADQLKEDGARFFQVHQVAAARLKTILQNPPDDEAHEVFNLQENGLWSNDVINDFDAAGFNYVGNAGLHHNLPTLAPHSKTGNFGKSLPTALQQMLFDVKWNVAQRRDIYARRNGTTDKANLASRLAGLPMYAVREALTEQSRQTLKKHFTGFDFCSPAANKCADIASEVSHFDELFAQMASGGVAADKSEDVVRHFLAARLISIAASPPAGHANPANVQISSQLNQNILVDDISAEYSRPFASPVAGSRVLLPIKDRLYLWKLVGMDLGEAWDRLGTLQTIFRGAGNKQLTRHEFVEIIEKSMPAFRQHALPELLRLGIVRPASLTD